MFDSIAQLPPAVFDTIGVIGFSVYVGNYCLLTFHKITSQSKMFFAMNLCAATMVLFGLMNSFNLASALTQMFWIVISITAIILRLRHDRRNAVSAGFA